MSVQDAFVWPAALPLLLLAPITWLVLHLLDRARGRDLSKLAGARVRLLAAEAGERRRHVRLGLFSIGLLAALAAVPQPVWGAGLRKVEQRGVDVLVCLDVSRSMLARDQVPDRLTAAQREIRALAERVRGDRLGLVLFAGEARLRVPLTQDAASFADLADLADTSSVQRGGTDLGAALDAALAALRGASGEHEAVLLLTDGEDFEQRGLRVAETCRARGITVHCVGFGSAQGSKIAVEGADGPAFLRDGDGEDVVTAMDPASLARIAEVTGGTFVEAATATAPLVALYEDEVLPMARKAFEAQERRERNNRYQWPLVAAFALWILELCLTDRRR